jgi:hypothetical protein
MAGIAALRTPAARLGDVKMLFARFPCKVNTIDGEAPRLLRRPPTSVIDNPAHIFYRF